MAIARQKELKYFLAKEVWVKRPRNEAYGVTCKRPISVKWVDVNKGDGINPNCRSRLVARDIRLPGKMQYLHQRHIWKHFEPCSVPLPLFGRGQSFRFLDGDGR